MLEMPPDVLSQAAGSLVPTDTVFLQGFHDDPIQIAPNGSAKQLGRGIAALGDSGQRLAERTQSGGGLDGLLLANDPCISDSRPAQLLLAEGCGPVNSS